MSRTTKQAPTSAEHMKARSASLSAGQRLLDLKLPASLVAMAAKLAKGGTFTAPQLATLRDNINTLAAARREAKQPAQAEKLSAANRLVRRLERAARKGAK